MQDGSSPEGGDTQGGDIHDGDIQGGSAHGGAPTPSSWVRRARGAGGRALGSAGQAMSAGAHRSTGHLGSEALVAYADGELGLGAHQRAAAHLSVCAECTAEVQAQLQARTAVRVAEQPCTPLGLLGSLRRIADAPPVPAAADDAPCGAGAVVQAPDGSWVSVLRPDRFGPRHDTPAPGRTR